MFGHPIDKEDILGQKFGRWSVLSVIDNYPTSRTYYSCRCSCGTIGTVKRAALFNTTSQSCGCLRREEKLIDLQDQNFGKLTVLKTIPGSRKLDTRSKSICLCQCGSILEVETSNLITKNTSSCGCIQKEKTIEGSKQFWNQKLIQEYGSLETYKIQKKIKTRLRSRIWHAVKNGVKVGSAVKDLSCTVEELKKHLESKFYVHPTGGITMSWENYGLGAQTWQIDHIKRLNDFNLTNFAQFKEACHYSNLQPLWFEDHLRKTMKEND